MIMAKKNLQAAAAGALAEMTPAQRMAQQAAQAAPAAPATQPAPAAILTEKKPTENTAPFTVWTTPENVRRWKAYQKAKKATLPTQAAFIVAAVLEYMTAHPVTDEEKAELLRSLDI